MRKKITIMEMTAYLKVKHCTVFGEEEYITIEVPIYETAKHLLCEGYEYDFMEGIWYKYP